jgi:hypothetical protein
MVTKSNRHEPTFSELADQFSVHYNISLLATRVGKPKDKPSVEKAASIGPKKFLERSWVTKAKSRGH